MERILFVANSSWFLYNFRSDIMLYMKNKGFEVIGVAPEDNYSNKIRELSIEHIAIKLDRKGKNIVKDFLLILKLAKIYKKYQPTVVHHFTIKPSIYGTMAARMAKVPRIANSITGLGYVFIEKNVTQRFVKFMYKLSFKSNRVRVIFENPDDKNIFVSNKIINEKHAFVIYGNGVDSTKFSIDNSDIASLPNFKKNDGCIIFSLFARMLWDKGIKEFVDAAKIVLEKKKNAKFYLVGGLDDGNPTAAPIIWLNNVSQNPNIQWIDHVEDVRTYMKISDVVVLPSAYKEGVPQSLIESASMSRPLITTDVSGCKEIVIDNLNGIIVPPKDSQKLAEAMLILANDAQKRKQMGVAGRNLMLQKFDSKIVIQNTIKVYFQS